MDLGIPAPSMAIANSTPSGAPASTPAPTPSPFSLGGNTGNQAVLVSSGPAQQKTATNVTKLQTVTTPPPQTNTNTNTNTNSGGTNTNTNPTLQDNSATVNEATARQLLGTDFTGATKNADGSYTLDKSALARISGGATPSTNGNSNSGTGSGDQYDAAVAGISDPGIAGQYKTTLQNLDTQISQAQTNIAAIKARSLNDPAITGIVSSISAKFDQQIQLMKARNAQLIGRANTSVAAFGGLGTMSQDFLNNEQSQADDRIQNLQNNEDAAIARAQSAYLTNNAKELDAAMTAYDAANKEKLSALNTLLTASSKQVTQMQAQQKIDMTAQKNALAADVTTSTKIAAGVASNIKAAGLTDPAQIKDYIAGIAAQYGINNPDILYSQIVTAGQTLDKNNLGMLNTQNEIDTRTQNTNNSTVRTNIAVNNANNGPKKSAADIKSDFYAGLATLDGQTSSDGTPYYYVSQKDKQSYLTAKGFSSLVTAAKEDGITRANFIKDNPDLFDPNGLDGYGLTAKEKAVIQK